MTECICGSGPYHKRKCPCHITYKMIREKELDLSVDPETANKTAQDLVKQGYVQVSRKYRRVVLEALCHHGEFIELDLATFEAFRAARIAMGKRP